MLIISIVITVKLSTASSIFIIFHAYYWIPHVIQKLITVEENSRSFANQYCKLKILNIDKRSLGKGDDESLTNYGQLYSI